MTADSPTGQPPMTDSSAERRAPTSVKDAWLAPDGELRECAPYGHVFLASELHDERPDVRAKVEQLMRDDYSMYQTNSHLTLALEELGFLKLATRRGVTDWYYHHATIPTPEQRATILSNGLPSLESR